MKASERRGHFRVGLNETYLTFYDALCAALGPEWQPYCGLRSIEEQNQLYAKHDGTTNAPGGDSAHNYGCASDWAFFDGENLLWLPKDDPRWTHYVNAVTSVHLRAGFEFGDIDHNELRISVPWRKVLEAIQDGQTLKGYLAHVLSP